MDRVELRKWTILADLTDEQIEDIEYIRLYGSDRCQSEGLSALMITKGNRDVFLTGFNSMVDSVKSPAKIQNTDRTDLIESVKVEELSGVGLKKIVVGFEFGAGLTDNNELYLWGEGPGMVLSKARTICYEVYTPNSLCSKCGDTYESIDVGSFLLNKCNKCNFVPSYSNHELPYGVQLRRFVMAYKIYIPCLRCRNICQSLHVGSCSLNYCSTCDLLREVSFKDVPSKSSFAPRKIELPETFKIVDIECGRSFLLLQTDDNRLIVWGSLGHFSYKIFTFGFLVNPDNIIFKSISCGSNHIAVLSYQGEVYTSGSEEFGQLGYSSDVADLNCLTLRKVPLPGRAVKVICRSTGTSCLLNDHTVYCWGSHLFRKGRRGKLLITSSLLDVIPSPVKLNGTFTDIESSPLTNCFSVKTDPLVLTWSIIREPRSRIRHPAITTAVDCLNAFVDRPLACSSTSSKPSYAFIRRFIPLCTVYSQFYNSPLFSDLTFKLSDGELPAHILVLHANSEHFKQLFSDAQPKEIDVSSYNPVAYRNLIKHLYGVQFNIDHYEDLFELHTIAVSYNETRIIEEIVSRLMESLKVDNVLKIHAKAKSANIDELVKECESFMDSSKYKNMIVKLLIRDSKKSTEALSMIMDD